MEKSTRITSLTKGGSDGWEVFYRARQMIKSGTPVVELTIGEHDIRTHGDILKAMQISAEKGHTGYAAVPGTDALRNTIAKRIQKRTRVPTKKNNIVITPGGQSALFSAHLAILDPGDIALYCDPYYATYPGTIRGAGAKEKVVTCYPEDNFQPQLSELSLAANGATSLLINSPNNPTGVVYDQTTFKKYSKCLHHKRSVAYLRRSLRHAGLGRSAYFTAQFAWYEGPNTHNWFHVEKPCNDWQ